MSPFEYICHSVNQTFSEHLLEEDFTLSAIFSETAANSQKMNHIDFEVSRPTFKVSQFEFCCELPILFALVIFEYYNIFQLFMIRTDHSIQNSGRLSCVALLYRCSVCQILPRIRCYVLFLVHYQ